MDAAIPEQGHFDIFCKSRQSFIDAVVDECKRPGLCAAAALGQRLRIVTEVCELKGVVATEYTVEELVYAPRNRRTHKVYGYSPVEQVLLTVNIAIRRALYQLQFYTEGSTPDLLFQVPADWNMTQIKDFNDWWQSILSGNTAQRRKAQFVPNGVTPINTKEGVLTDKYDEWLARIICYAFSVSHQAFVAQVNRATAESAQQQALEEGLYPVMQWVKGVVDTLIWKYFGYTDLEFVWEDQDAVAPDVQSQIDDRAVKNGTMTINEIRAKRGDDPVEGGDAAMVLTALLSEACYRLVETPIRTGVLQQWFGRRRTRPGWWTVTTCATSPRTRSTTPSASTSTAPRSARGSSSTSCCRRTRRVAVVVHIPAHWRDRSGGRATVEVEGRNLREVFSILKGGGMLGLLVDWGFKPDGIPVRLFDAPTMLPAGPAYLAAKTGASILSLFALDYVLAAVPATACADLVAQAAGVAPFVHVISGGFREASTDGLTLEASLLATARARNLRIWLAAAALSIGLVVFAGAHGISFTTSLLTVPAFALLAWFGARRGLPQNAIASILLLLVAAAAPARAQLSPVNAAGRSA